MTAADELRAAAAKVREMAIAATPGQWQATNLRRAVRASNGYPVADYIGEDRGDAAWIAFMCPDKAEALAAWLEAEAACQDAIAEDVASQTLARVLDAIAGREVGAELTTSFDVGPFALAFARSILGGVS